MDRISDMFTSRIINFHWKRQSLTNTKILWRHRQPHTTVHPYSFVIDTTPTLFAKVRHLFSQLPIALPSCVLTAGVMILTSCGQDSVNKSTLSANQMCKIIEDQRSSLNLEPAGVSDTGVCCYKTIDNNLSVYVSGPGSSYLDKGEPVDIPDGKKHKTSETYSGWNIENTTIIPRNQEGSSNSCYSKITTREWSLLVLSIGTCDPAKNTLHTLLKSAKK